MALRILPFLLLLILAGGCARTRPAAAPAPAQAARALEPWADTLEARTFAWFRDVANPANGLVPDRWPTKSFSSVAAIGFALTGYGIGAERGYMPRAEAVQRTLTTLRFLWRAPQGPEAEGRTGYRGLFYHFLDMDTGQRFKTVELSTIDTALLLGGTLFAQSYYDRDDPAEAEIRALADSLYRRVDWRWAVVRAPLLSMGWHPESGFIDADYKGYNEAMLLYVLALGSPTHPIDPTAWTAFSGTYIWGDFHGQEHVNFSPLFGHQYSHAWIDFRGIRDPYMRGRGIDYFENSRRAALSQRAYAVANPRGWTGYGPDVWGLTACDGPANVRLKGPRGDTLQFQTYAARGASLEYTLDDGTIAPTAVGGSVAFAPEVCLPALRTMTQMGEPLYTRYGFVDAFNPSFTYTDVPLGHGHVVPGRGWFDHDYLGIDQGPILLMLENYRSELVWRTMQRNPHIVRGLRAAGFSGGWLDGAQPATAP